MHGVSLAGIELNRKMLADLATHEPEAFAQLCARARDARQTASAA
jgi:large subunit ribosomal protein L20